MYGLSCELVRSSGTKVVHVGQQERMEEAKASQGKALEAISCESMEADGENAAIEQQIAVLQKQIAHNDEKIHLLEGHA